jgi:RHS repeat-associated protein
LCLEYNLNYTYNATSNKILKVDDASGETASFKDVSGNDYDYWLDGSLKKDNNKEITQIDYNYLKLPQKINLTGGRWIDYEYDASGVKLKKTLSTGKVTDYEEDDIYENGVLYQTAHDEGRIVDGIYEYNITDHLGNVRVSFKDSAGVAKITQVNHVGAWGEPLTGINSVNTPKINNFTLSTYEKENDFGIGVFDAHARVFDPVTPRFWQIDPLAEKYFDLNGYNYVANNPILLIDPFGADIKYNWGTKNYEEDGKYVGTDYAFNAIKSNDNSAGGITFKNGKGNLAIMNNVSYRGSHTQTFNIGAMESGNSNWDIMTIENGNFDKISTLLSAYSKVAGKIKNFLIASHGNNDYQVGVSENNEMIPVTGQRISQYLLGKSQKSMTNYLDGLSSIALSMEKGGNMIFASCMCGYSADGKLNFATTMGNMILKLNPSLNTWFSRGLLWFGSSAGDRQIGFNRPLEAGASSGWSIVNSQHTTPLQISGSIQLNKTGTPINLPKF